MRQEFAGECLLGCCAGDNRLYAEDSNRLRNVGQFLRHY